MNDIDFKNDLYLEIADFSKNDGYIKYRVYNSRYYNDYDKADIIPFSTYYLEALSLNIIANDDNYLTEFIDFCEKAFFVCNRTNQEKINKIIKKASNRLRNIIIRSDKGENGIYLNELNDFMIKDNVDVVKVYDSFKNWANQNKKIVDDFEHKKGNCVAIAMPIYRKLFDSENCYLALSGCSKDYAGILCASKWKILSDVQDAYDAINELLYSIYNVRFKECHFLDETMRYTYYDSRKDFSRKTTNGKVLKRPTKFSFDYKNHCGNEDEIKRLQAHYSCCERKILAHMGFVNNGYQKLVLKQNILNKLSIYEFRIKFEPCRMCRPALIGCYYIGCDFLDVFSFATKTLVPEKTIVENTIFDLKKPLILGIK